MGEEFLTPDKMKLLIEKMEPLIDKMGLPKPDLHDLETRLELHVANLKYAYGQRMKTSRWPPGSVSAFS